MSVSVQHEHHSIPYKTFFIGLSISVGVGQCEHTIRDVGLLKKYQKYQRLFIVLSISGVLSVSSPNGIGSLGQCLRI